MTLYDQAAMQTLHRDKLLNVPCIAKKPSEKVAQETADQRNSFLEIQSFIILLAAGRFGGGGGEAT